MQVLPYLILVAAWSFYFILHSFTATKKFKSFFPKGRQRLYFNLIAVVSLIVPGYFHLIIASPLLFQSLPISFTGVFVAFLGLIIIIQSFKGYSLLEFVGLKLENDGKHSKLFIDGWNKRVRHPLYFGSIILIIGLFFYQPTFKMLLSGLMMILYFAIGSYFEEKKLIEQFGKEYLDYMKITPKLIPKFFFLLMIIGVFMSCETQQSTTLKNVIVFESFEEEPQLVYFDLTPQFHKRKAVDTILLGDSAQFQFLAETKGNGFILPAKFNLRINTKEITGKGFQEVLYFQGLIESLSFEKDTLIGLLKTPESYLLAFREMNFNRKARYAKTFLFYNQERQDVFKAFDLSFKVSASNQFLNYWEPDSNVFFFEERVDSFFLAINKLHTSMLYHPQLFYSVEQLCQSAPSDSIADSLQLEKLNFSIEKLNSFQLTETSKQIIQFQIIANTLQSGNFSLSEIEKTSYYNTLSNPKFYNYLNNLALEKK